MFPSHLLGARRMDNLHSATGSLSDQISTMTLHSDESDDSDESGEMETLPVPRFGGASYKDVLNYVAYKFVITKLNLGRKRYRKCDLIYAIDTFRHGEPLTSQKNISSEKIFQYLKEKRFFLYKARKQMASLKPIVCHGDSHTMLAFSTSNNLRMEHHLCKLCDRGFPSYKGLSDHFIHAVHSKEEEKVIARITRDDGCYKCPLNGCDFKSKTHEDVVKHIQEDKVFRVDRSSGQFDIKPQPSPEFTKCDTCNVRVLSRSLFRHQTTLRHTRNEKAARYQNERAAMMENKSGIEITEVTNGEDGLADRIKLDDERTCGMKTLKYIIHNTGTAAIAMLQPTLYKDIPGLAISFPDDMATREDIQPLGEIEVSVKVEAVEPGVKTLPIVFKFGKPGVSLNSIIYKFSLGATTILREKTLTCIRQSDVEMYDQLQPVTPYTPHIRHRDSDEGKLKVVESDFLPEFESGNQLEMTLKLERYFIPSNLIFYLKSHMDKEDLLQMLNIRDLDYSNYSQYFNNLLYIEELQMRKDIDRYTMPNAQMLKDSRTNLLTLKVPGLAENRPSVLRGDRLYATPKSRDGNRYQGIVHHVGQADVKLGFYTRMRENFCNGMVHKIEFTINRLPMKVEHRAATWAGERDQSLRAVLFPEAISSHPSYVPHNLKFYDQKLETNPEQKTAVYQILRGSSKPAPYLIFGPPGTGKTVTMVEAIKQVYSQKPDSKILACAPQNDAADLITQRLIKGGIDEKDIIRLHALSRPRAAVEDKILRVSNYDRDGKVMFPCKEDLQKIRIIVVTLVTSGRLVSADMGSHFTHIFIDEAGHATEPETIIPLSGLLNVNMRNGGQVVLAGDPKQLGPIIRSDLAKMGGLGMSMLERLMNDELYMKDPDTKKYDSDYVTKLVNSFRSHPDILKIPNELYYEGELKVCADELQRNRFCNWERLPEKNFPLIFHGMIGQERQEANSPSFFNLDEIAEIKQYVQNVMDIKSPRVLAADIGIISPYHRQVTKIREELKRLQRGTSVMESTYKKYENISVGSVEKFQGQEREIIIISTVRSQDVYLKHDKDFNLGFVGNPKRFNVAVTRAKALLIVIGNPFILCQDENWRRLIQYIHKNGGCTGSPVPDDLHEPRTESTVHGTQAAGGVLTDEEESHHQAMVDPGIPRKDA